MKKEIKEKQCEHNWIISCFEQYPDIIDGRRYCYIICSKCGEVRRQVINQLKNERKLKNS